MHTVQINLNSVDKVKAFVHSVNTFNTEFDLVSGLSLIHICIFIMVMLTISINITIIKNSLQFIKSKHRLP